ncbi:MAG: SDR family oxidoreductase [Patescibacteria group bacterium]|nr:SDR family oxidoreductase [Patescibacteria group bacterium]
MRKKIILVAGGAGFIGSHLCRRLVGDGYKVICWDNLYSGRLENIADLRGNSNFSFVKTDITKKFSFKNKVDEIYNLACIASPGGYQRRPLETLLASSVGVKNLLDLAVQCKAKFLQTSTSEVYGDPLVHPQKESYWGNVNPVGERSCYDEGKRFAESLIYTYRNLYKLEAKIVRIFNTYGPKMHPSDGRAISTFLSQALTGKPVTVFGDGLQTRSFCYVSDMVSGLILMMKSREFGPINLGNPGEFTILKLAGLIVKLVRSSSQIAHLDLPADDPVKRKPDITLAKKLLGWQPKISLEEGLKLSLPYYQSQIKSRSKVS